MIGRDVTRVAAAWLALTASVQAQSVGAESPTIEPVPVVGVEALGAFHGALRELESAVGARSRVRLMHYGDSNVAAGTWTRVARERLQRRYGDGGPGWVVPGPWGSRVRAAVQVTGGEAWLPRRLGAPPRYGTADGLWGLAGVGVHARGRDRVVRLRLPADVDRTVVVHALGWRRGGALSISVDDGPSSLVVTRTARPTAIRHRVVLGPGAHVITVRPATHRPVRLLGFDVERDRTGVVYDVLGINGHRANAMLRWDPALWRAQLVDRPADLVVLAYGGNEALDPDLNLRAYERQLEASIARARAAAAGASCLVVAPVAQCDEPHRVAEVVHIQRRVSSAVGCAFWDTTAVSGGPSSLCAWIRHGLVSPDRLHLTEDGYRLVGERFAEALMPR